MITKDELATRIALALAQRSTMRIDPRNWEREAMIAAEAAEAAFSVDPDAPQTVTLTFKLDVMAGEVGTLLSAAAHAMQQAAAVSDDSVERAAEAGWNAHRGLHPGCTWAEASPSNQAMFRTVARAALETRAVTL